MPDDVHVEVIRRLCRHIETHADEPLTLAALGERAGMSPPHLQRVFNASRASRRDNTPALADWIASSPPRGRETVTRATYAAGFGSSSRVYESAGEQLGMTPGAYRNGAMHHAIGYAIADCPLGRLLMAATEKGICAVILGDDDAELIEWLSEEFPAADIAADDGRLAGWLGEILVISLVSGRTWSCRWTCRRRLFR